MSDLKKIIKINYKNFEIDSKCDMPSLITSANDFKIFSLFIDEPNFTGNKPINAKLIFINKYKNEKKLDNKIVVIDSADPGYDWIFNYKIRGLITKYGGVNSHMAIRCAELNLTAAIGVGDKIFSDLRKSTTVIINPNNKILRTL
jgi:phosphohistidine swiveling domain-containing protein